MADQKLPVAVAATVAILGAIAGVLQFLPATTTQVIDVVNRPKASFDDSMQQLETGLKSPKPSVLALRTTAAEAYRRAGQAWFGRATDWKCQVVDLFYNEMDPILAEAMPLAAYSDYEAAKLTPCDAHVFTVATLDWNTFLTLKAQSDGSTQRLEAIRHVVAQGTKAQVVGWAYLGELDSQGRYTIKYIHEPAANVGDTVTTASEATADGVMLHLFPPAPDDSASQTSIGGIAGFLPDGSKMTILKLGRLPRAPPRRSRCISGVRRGARRERRTAAGVGDWAPASILAVGRSRARRRCAGRLSSDLSGISAAQQRSRTGAALGLCR